MVLEIIKIFVLVLNILSLTAFMTANKDEDVSNQIFYAIMYFSTLIFICN